MTFTEAAAEVLRLAGKPMHYKEITELAIEKNLLSHVGKSPEITMASRLTALLKKDDKTNPIVRVKPGVFALRDWSSKGKRTSKAPEVDAAVEGEDASDDMDVNALEVEAMEADDKLAEGATSEPDLGGLAGGDDDDEPIIVSGDDQIRADLAASGAELFDDEEDDDQPILASTSAPDVTAGADGQGGEQGRRRRRRRRRGRGGERGEPGMDARFPQERASSPRLDSGFGQNGYTVSDVEGTDGVRESLSPSPRPMVRDRQQIMAGGAPTGIDVPLPEGEDLTGRDLADAAAILLGTFDRNGGPVPLRTVVENLMRRGRLAGDHGAAIGQLSAALRADNLRRSASAQRPRFRLSQGGRVALTDWALSHDLVRLEQEVAAAVDRYREASRRVFLRRIQELPGHSFVELALLALERVGVTQLKAVRRPGLAGGEIHYAGVHRSGADEVRVAVVIRKDGREVGREKVTDLRGALHHYNGATGGWIITTGQVLSGARDEASAPGASPVALFDGFAFCRLLEDNDVGVVKTKHTVAIADLEFLEQLRG
jgi:hypothetical protein